MKTIGIRWKRSGDKAWHSELEMSYGTDEKKLNCPQDSNTRFNLTLLNLVVCVGMQVGFFVIRFNGVEPEASMPWSCIVLPSVVLFLVFSIMFLANACCGKGGKISILMGIALIALSCSIVSLGVTLDMFWPLPLGWPVIGGMLAVSVCLFIYCIVLCRRS
jgi:hypothetical protein